ncbi:hypothetical protein FQN60_014569, partial [Etheostoma spectabile]
FRGVPILLHPTQLHQDQALYARLLLDELRDACTRSGVSPLAFTVEHQFPGPMPCFLCWNHVHSCLAGSSLPLTRSLHSNFPASEIDNCYHRAAEGRARRSRSKIQSKVPGITERARLDIY